jgi:hypothetical protein
VFLDYETGSVCWEIILHGSFSKCGYCLLFILFVVYPVFANGAVFNNSEVAESMLLKFAMEFWRVNVLYFGCIGGARTLWRHSESNTHRMSSFTSLWQRQYGGINNNMAAGIRLPTQYEHRMYTLRLIFQLSSTLAQSIVGSFVKLTKKKINKRFRRWHVNL